MWKYVTRSHLWIVKAVTGKGTAVVMYSSTWYIMALLAYKVAAANHGNKVIVLYSEKRG